MNTEQTKKCRQCQMDIPKKARRCPHCRAKQGIGLFGAFIILMIFGVLAGNVMSSLRDAREVDVPEVDTFVPRTVESNFELGTYKVESEEFQYITPKEVNLWKSYSDRKKVGSVKEHAIVEVTAHDDTNDYCKVTAGEQIGWMACGWLVKQ